MADAANGAAEDVLAKEEEVLVEEALAAEGGVTEKIDAVKEGGVGESLKIPHGEGFVAEAKEKDVAVEGVVTEVASETVPIPVEDRKGAAILDPVVEAGEESSGTAYVVAKEFEQASLSKAPEVPPVVVEQEEIPESTGNPAGMPVSGRTVPPASWRSCCGLFDVLRGS